MQTDESRSGKVSLGGVGDAHGGRRYTLHGDPVSAASPVTQPGGGGGGRGRGRGDARFTGNPKAINSAEMEPGGRRAGLHVVRCHIHQLH